MYQIAQHNYLEARLASTLMGLAVRFRVTYFLSDVLSLATNQESMDSTRMVLNVSTSSLMEVALH
ncbi:uncharacterized protein LOC142578017 isoform X3 [Dermacentor variabilis]|uniref:uncharacterized protein LOC142578017 isoform X3 n=1 Tax=Dermacentor variabilis TaxID=34621 RepID=UPI003F5B78D9